MAGPDVRYAQNAGISIAYQVFGDGPVDLFILPGGIWHVELLWSEPNYERMMRRFASFARVIAHDRSGMGASDPGFGIPTLEDRLEKYRR